MTAEPVQVLVTIHPPEGVDIDWLRVVDEAMRDRDGWPLMPLWERWFECDLVHGQPHGEAKAHREAAERALEDSDMMSRHDDGWWQHRAMQAVAHALLALGERP